MLPDWLLLILLFIGIALVPLYEPLMTPLEYFQAGLSTLFQSVGAFFGLLLLAILLLASGGVLLAGYENVAARLTGSNSIDEAGSGEDDHGDEVASTVPADPLDHHYPPPPVHPARANKNARTRTRGKDGKAALRPYRVAKSLHLGGDDKLWGLVLVIAGLSLLWIIPSYMFSSSSSTGTGRQQRGSNLADPFTPPTDYGARSSSSSSSWSHKDAVSNSKAGQMVMGFVVFTSLLVIFAFLGPSPSPSPSAAEQSKLHEKDKGEARTNDTEGTRASRGKS